MKITVDVLREHEACAKGISDFARVFPAGLDSAESMSRANLSRAIGLPKQNEET